MILMVNVGNYTIHGSYRIEILEAETVSTLLSSSWLLLLSSEKGWSEWEYWKNMETKAIYYIPMVTIQSRITYNICTFLHNKSRCIMYKYIYRDSPEKILQGS